MSTREQHPIDDHFRRSLVAAEVEPPAHVWAGVAAAQGGRTSRRGLWFWSLLVLLGVGAAGTYHFFGSAEGTAENTMAMDGQRENAAHAPEPAAADPVLANDSTGEEAMVAGAAAAESDDSRNAADHSDQGRDHKRAMSTLAGTTAAGPAARNSATGQSATSDAQASPEPAAKVHQAPSAQGGPPVVAEANVQDPEAPADPGSAAAMGGSLGAVSTPEVGAAWAIGLDTRPGRMFILPPPDLFADPAPALRGASALAAPYVLAPSEWWVGPSVGIIGSRLRWRGDDAELAEAINKVSGTRNDLAYGIAFGRTWCSGWGFSSAVQWQQGQQRRTLLDRRTVVEQELVPRVVSLDAVVVFSTTDTLTTTTTTETALGGVERSTVLRIPLQAHWHGTRGRLLYGAHLGLVLEHTTYRGGPTLVRDASDGRIAAVDGDALQGKERFPIALLGTAGVDVGLQLHERWALRGGPVLMPGLAPLQRTSTVYAMPDRFGLQFQLVHHLYRRSPR